MGFHNQSLARQITQHAILTLSEYSLAFIYFLKKVHERNVIKITEKYKVSVFALQG